MSHGPELYTFTLRDVVGELRDVSRGIEVLCYLTGGGLLLIAILLFMGSPILRASIGL
jgi:hypothetical protein